MKQILICDEDYLKLVDVLDTRLTVAHINIKNGGGQRPNISCQTEKIAINLFKKLLRIVGEAKDVGPG